MKGQSPARQKNVVLFPYGRPAARDGRTEIDIAVDQWQALSKARKRLERQERYAAARFKRLLDRATTL